MTAQFGGNRSGRGEDQDDEEAARSEAYPSSASLRAEIDELVKTGPVSRPTFDSSFPSTRPLFIQLHAYARQRGFTLFRRGGSASTPTSTNLLCSKFGPGGRGKGEKECGFSVKVEKGGDGRWRVTKVKAEHSGHAFARREGVQSLASASGKGKVKDEQDEPRSSTTDKPAKRPRLASPPPTAFRPTQPSAFCAPPPIHRPPLAHAVPASFAPPPFSFSPSAHQPIPPDPSLVAFLHSFAPSLPFAQAGVSTIAALLASPSVGIRTADDLIALAEMEEITAGMMLDEVAKRVGPERRREMESVVRALRGEFAMG
ncbi:hypothetical protein JCM8547_000895 [Rhodosporidiobolus lusitaniae]